MRMEVSKDGSPVFIRVIRVIRGLFTAYFGLRTACRDSSALSRLQIFNAWCMGTTPITGFIIPSALSSLQIRIDGALALCHTKISGWGPRQTKPPTAARPHCVPQFLAVTEHRAIILSTITTGENRGLRG